MYDIYLSSGCHEPPDLSGLPAEAAGRFNEERRARLLEARPGFLGLNLSQDAAYDLLTLLESARARGLVVPSAYRNPKVTKAAAEEIARHYLVRTQQEDHPALTFDAVRFCDEDAMWWVFHSPSPDWLAAGFSPGVLYAFVDKLDGHIWGDDERQRLAEEIEAKGRMAVHGAG